MKLWPNSAGLNTPNGCCSVRSNNTSVHVVVVAVVIFKKIAQRKTLLFLFKNNDKIDLNECQRASIPRVSEYEVLHNGISKVIVFV